MNDSPDEVLSALAADASWVRMSSARTPPMRKKTKPVTMKRRPTIELLTAHTRRMPVGGAQMR